MLEIDFKTRDMLAEKADGEPYICYQCGTCTVSRLLNPEVPVRKVIRRIQLGAVPRYDEIWKCISCNYCGAMCPRGVDVSRILRSVRVMLYEEKRVPNDFNQLLWTVYENGNPLGSPKRERFSWASDIRFSDNPEVLLYSCCLSSYDKRLQSVLRALVKIFKSVGVKVGVLENGESCCGDVVYHTGEDYFLEEIASNNVSAIEDMKPSLVITVSPHVYHLFKNVYPRFGAKLSMPVMHHVEYLSELFDEGRIKVGRLNETVTYHDPCYLGRYNGIYEEPRNLIEGIDGVRFIEMEHNKANTLCCGGGGGGIWTENKEARGVTRARLYEAAELNVNTMVTSCPYCIRMFEDENKILGYSFPVLDVVEFLSRSIGGY